MECSKVIFRAVALGAHTEDDFREMALEAGGRFDKSPNVSRPRVTSKTVSRDATRCYYCKEPGHIS